MWVLCLPMSWHPQVLGHLQAQWWPNSGVVYIQNLDLTDLGRHKMVVISQTTLSNAFSWMKMLKFLLKFQWGLFPSVQLTITSIGSDNGLAPTRRQVIIWTMMVRSSMHICVTRPQWVKILVFVAFYGWFQHFHIKPCYQPHPLLSGQPHDIKALMLFVTIRTGALTLNSPGPSAPDVTLLGLASLQLPGQLTPQVTLSQSPCTALMAGKLPAIRAVQGDYEWPLKNGGISHQFCKPIMHWVWGVPWSIYASASHITGNTASKPVSQMRALLTACLTPSQGWT